MDFDQFREIVQRRVLSFCDDHEFLFQADIDKAEIYDLYLGSFPDEANPIHVERTSHDCNSCKIFIRRFGGVVAIVNNQIVTVWDDMPGLDVVYGKVAKALADYVRSCGIADRFMSVEKKIGNPSNVVQLSNGLIHTWTHLYAELPDRFVVRRGQSVGAAIGETRDTKQVFQRALTELTVDSVETVLDLISQNSLYRGAEFKPQLESFLQCLQEYVATGQKDLYCWLGAGTRQMPVTKIRNSAIGTLLIDLSEGLDLDQAVRKFESVVAPTNYKRPNAIFSKKMLEDAERTVAELGLLESLPRRFATIEDVQIRNVLWANTNVMRQVEGGSIFEQMSKAISANPRQFSGVEEIAIEKFLADVLPRLSQVEVWLENKHAPNLVSVIAPASDAAPSLFKWSNGFSWAYAGNIADSMKKRVKAAGGKVDGVLRFSIQWNEDGDNQNDFDAHCVEPTGNQIWYQNKTQRHFSSGMLDVDIINPGKDIAVENIAWANLDRMPEGSYSMMVNCFSDRGGQSGFRAEIEFDGQVLNFDYPKPMRNKETIEVANIEYSRTSGFTVRHSLTSAASSKTLWNKPTNQFHPVSALMLSPNYWDEQQSNGNKHFFFLLDDCINDESPNGFFNEFLRNDLMQHKRVFEALGGRMKVNSDDPKQLSGLGFSSTQRNALVCKITGNTERIIKIVF